jgi:hypothetical protein
MIRNSCGCDPVITGLHGFIQKLSREIRRQVRFCIHRRTIAIAADETQAHSNCCHSKTPHHLPKLQSLIENSHD